VFQVKARRKLIFGSICVLALLANCSDNADEQKMLTPPPGPNTNQAPVAEAGTKQSVAVSTRVILDGSASTDPDGDTLTYQWRQTAGDQVTLMVDTGQTVTFIAPDTATSLVFELLVNDGMLSSAPDTVIIEVYRMEANRPPLADAGIDRTVMSSTTVHLDGSASRDPDGDLLDYSWEQISGPAVTLSDETEVRPSFIAPNEDTTLVFGLTVNDGSLDSEVSRVNITVRMQGVNLAPTAHAGDDRRAAVNARVQLDGSQSSDPEGDALSYRWRQLSGESVSLMNVNTATPSFTAPATAGIVEFELVVNDGGLDSPPDSIRITLVKGNTPPVAVGGPNQTVLGGAMVDLDGSQSYDPDGDPLTAEWTFTSSDSPVLAHTDRVITRFRAPNQLGVLTVQLTVSDGVSTSTPSTVQITINNRRPTARAGNDFSVEVGAMARLNGNGSADADQQSLTATWVQVAGPQVSLSDPTSLRPSFVATSTPAVLSFDLVVNDGQVDSGRDRVSVYVVATDFVDTDGDFLSDSTEASLGTNPNNADTDRDGIPDGWEVMGHEGVDFAALGCNPRRRNILVEADYQHYMGNGRLNSAQPSPAWIDAVKAFYAGLDIPNHDGSTGIDIEFFPDTQLDEDYLCYYQSGSATGDISAADFAHRDAFHKATFCIGGGRGNSTISGRSLKLRSGRTNNNAADDLTERNQFSRYFLFLHEMGHSLGLLHGGNQNMNRNPNYPSLMNYEYDASFDGSPRTIQGTRVHYSDGSLPRLDECNLVEENALGSVPAADLSFLQYYGQGWTVDANHNIDWNRNMMTETTPYSLVIRLQASPASCQVMRDHDDLNRIANRMARALPSDPN